MKPYNREGATKGEEVREMFDTIAPSYDRLNHILSMQIDKLWRWRVVRIMKHHINALNKTNSEPKRILDVATGTGDLAIAMARNIEGIEVLGVDPSQGMLDVAVQKIESQKLNIKTQCCSAEKLPLDDSIFDGVTASFGVRNFSDLEGGLREMVRVTKVGGIVIVLEFSTPPNAIFKWFYNLYSRHILPRIGAMISRDRKAYEYLPASVEEFATRSEFLALMSKVGLGDCYARSQSFGIAQIYVGIKK
ncbi:MAG: bifunctional demethylmenaquinone methyltransferase/2-methoxy-6-polyprenyl-1,4-benzoquinol methylase UbiE [Rikenellaceae bacterium]